MLIVKEQEPRRRQSRGLAWAVGVLSPVILAGVLLAVLPVEAPVRFQLAGTPYTIVAIDAGNTRWTLLADAPQGVRPFADSYGMAATMGWTVRIGRRVFAVAWFESSSRYIR